MSVHNAWKSSEYYCEIDWRGTSCIAYMFDKLKVIYNLVWTT